MEMHEALGSIAYIHETAYDDMVIEALTAYKRVGVLPDTSKAEDVVAQEQPVDCSCNMCSDIRYRYA